MSEFVTDARKVALVRTWKTYNSSIMNLARSWIPWRGRTAAGFGDINSVFDGRQTLAGTYRVI